MNRRRLSEWVLLMMAGIGSPLLLFGRQAATSATDGGSKQRVLVVGNDSKNDSLVAIPPSLTSTVSFQQNKKASVDAIDLRTWMERENGLNGLEETGLQPWHIVVSYDQYDDDGDNVHSGVYEEFWAGEKKYKRIYKSDDLNQTDYATEKGLFRQGDQRWPSPVHVKVRSEIVEPFYYAATLEGFHGTKVERNFGNYSMECVLIEKDNVISDPTQYCFEPGGAELRYARGFGWFQTVYNEVGQFQGRNIAKSVEVTDGGKPYLKLRVEKLESLANVDEGFFEPPKDASGPLSGRISGVQLQAIKTTPFPEWPASIRSQHFIVKVEIVVGKDGRVLSAHAVSGPPEAYKASEAAVKKWAFKPYLVLGQPVEVEQKVELSNN